jgi:hypothetical protein
VHLKVKESDLCFTIARPEDVEFAATLIFCKLILHLVTKLW